jgi:hypothetical protein
LTAEEDSERSPERFRWLTSAAGPCRARKHSSSSSGVQASQPHTSDATMFRSEYNPCDLSLIDSIRALSNRQAAKGRALVRPVIEVGSWASTEILLAFLAMDLDHVMADHSFPSAPPTAPECAFRFCCLEPTDILHIPCTAFPYTFQCICHACVCPSRSTRK